MLHKDASLAEGTRSRIRAMLKRGVTRLVVLNKILSSVPSLPPQLLRNGAIGELAKVLSEEGFTEAEVAAATAAVINSASHKATDKAAGANADTDGAGHDSVPAPEAPTKQPETLRPVPVQAGQRHAVVCGSRLQFRSAEQFAIDAVDGGVGANLAVTAHGIN
jgi:hypothetical protein